MLKFNKITIHCSDTPASMDIGVKEIRDWHVNGNGWDDIGYHYVIRRNGGIESGRPIDQIGAHVAGHNEGNIGVCLVGGKGGFNFTCFQIGAMRALFEALGEEYGRDIRIMGHCDLDPNKTCPNFDVKAFFGG